MASLAPGRLIGFVTTGSVRWIFDLHAHVSLSELGRMGFGDIMDRRPVHALNPRVEPV